MSDDLELARPLETDRRTVRHQRASAGNRPRAGLARLGVAVGATHPSIADGSGTEPTRGGMTLTAALQLADEALAAAEESYHRVLTIFESLLGDEHHEVGVLHLRLAEAAQARGRSDQADYHTERARSTRRVSAVAEFPPRAALPRLTL